MQVITRQWLAIDEIASVVVSFTKLIKNNQSMPVEILLAKGNETNDDKYCWPAEALAELKKTFYCKRCLAGTKY
jgi:hypothetical protein